MPQTLRKNLANRVAREAMRSQEAVAHGINYHIMTLHDLLRIKIGGNRERMSKA
jgi:hypothetical protein